MKWLKRLSALLLALLVAAIGYLLVAPPDLLRVGANYTAKMVCSNVFVAGRNADEVLAIDVQAPPVQIERLDLSVDEAHSSLLAQPKQVDVQLSMLVGTGQIRRQHAGIRRLRFARDERHPGPVRRLHAEGTHDFHVSMTTAEQHEIPCRRQQRRVGIDGLSSVV